MAQGPIQCIDCQDGISFEAWAGKPLPEKLPRPLSPGQELNLNGDSRWWNPDPRDPLKDQKDPGYNEGFAGDDRWDLETRMRFEHHGETKQGFTVINRQFGL